MVKLTKNEKQVINQLKNLAEIWPKTLWLFAAGSNLHIMKTDSNGNQAVLSSTGGMDPTYSITRINIPSGGGDW